jgi:UDP-2-acetamido-3-amino-2,3-dideoxy-glucuronate N-acetyltransferase
VKEFAVIDPTAVLEAGAIIGPGTKIWHFSHVVQGARIGENCVVGQGCYVAGSAVIGNRVRVQNHVSVFDGVQLEDDVFCGPGVTFTNVRRPRSEFPKHGEYETTLVRRGATLGAGCTVVCGIVLGEYCFVAAGAVVTKDVPAHALVAGVPARWVGWVSRCGEDLSFELDGFAICPRSGDRHRLSADRVELVEV